MENEYPTLTERIKANITDYFMLCLMLMAVTPLVEAYPDLPYMVKISLFVFIFIGYDPLFTTLFGGTIGHFTNGIRVKRAYDTSRNIPFLNAVLRYVLKVFLGIFSLITMNSKTQYSAIHDLAADSIVVYKEKK